MGNLGNAYRRIGNHQVALQHFEQHLEIARELGDERSEGADWGNLGLTYAAMGDINRAIECIETAIMIFDKIEDPRLARLRSQLALWQEQVRV